MKRLSIIIFILKASLLLSQTSVQDKIDFQFQNLNSSKLTTGILMNKSLVFSNIFAYSNDTIADYGQLRELYQQLKNGAYNRGAIPSIDVYNTYAKQVYDVQKKVPILLLNYEYQTIDIAAYNSGLITFNGSQFIDHTGPNQNPFIKQHAFAAATFIDNTNDNKIQFYLDSKFILSNSGAITNLLIDFNDGHGYQSVSLGQTISISYGTKGDKLIKVKATLFGGSIFQTTARIHINNDLINVGAKILGNAQEQFITFDKNPANTTFFNSYYPAIYDIGKNVASIRLGTDPQSGISHTAITQPLFFVEGIDFGQTHNGKHGDLGYIDFIKGNNPDYPQLSMSPYLIRDLNKAGYDVIYLDFNDGAIDMEENALAVVNVINYVNSIKSGFEENVVIGASMGGQLARYALAYMESNNMKHCTRDYISFDSPHKGANIPLCLQEFLQFFKTMDDKAKLALDNKLDRPASQQLVIYHHFGIANNSLRQQWLSKRNAVGVNGYPVKLRKAAAINGSNSSVDIGFSSGAKLIDWHWSLLGLKKIDVDGYAQPGDLFGTVFSGVAPDLSSVNIKAPLLGQNPPLWDNAPGSPNNAIKQIKGDKKKYDGFIGYIDIGFTQVPHEEVTFIPSVSALDVNSNDLFFDIKNKINQKKPNPNLTPFEGYYANPSSSNQQHVEITYPNYALASGIGTTNISNTNSEWLLIEELPLTKNRLPTVLTSTFNFTGLLKSKLYSVSISNGGILKINGAGIGNDIPPNSTPNTSVPGSKIETWTNGCGAIVEIRSGGQMILGESSTNNSAIVHFDNGSGLIIRSGSKLILCNNSQLIMESGSFFTVEPGAEIQLLGSNSLIDVQSTVNSQIQINNGQTLKITRGTATLGGTIQFADGAVSLFSGSRLINDGCKILLKPAVNFSLQPNTEIQLIGINALIDVQNSNTNINIGASQQFFVTQTTAATQGGTIKFAGGNFQLTGSLINDNCTIMLGYNQSLGQNMKLFYNNGAVIQLKGLSAILDIQGDLHIDNNTTFTFSNIQPHGFVRFSRQGWWGGASNPHIKVGTGSAMLFNGTGQTDKMLEITQESLYAPDILSRLTITNGLVAMGSGSRLNLPCPFTLRNAKVTTVIIPSPGNTTPLAHRGIQLFGQAGVVINNSLIDYGGINADLFYGGNMLNINNCTIQNYGTGIKTTGVGVNLNTVKFFDNGFGGTGLEIDGADQPCTITNCEITGNGIGVLVNNGTSSPELRFVNCSIHDNDESGIENNGGNVLVRCGTVKNNLIQGIYAGPGSVTNLSSLFGAGYTDLSGNAITVNTLTANDLKLAKGFNDFEITENENSRYAFGLGMKTVIPLVMEGSLNQYWGNVIDASNNKWNAAGVNLSTVPFVERFYRLIGTGAPDSDGNRNITLKDDATPKIASCPVIPPGPAPGPVVFDPTLVGFLAVCTTCPIINSSSFLNVKYNDAVTFALKQSELVDSTKNDLSAINLLREILMTKIDSANPQVLAIAQLATQQIGLILSHAFQTGKITPVLNAATLSPPVQQVADVYNRLKAPATSINYLSQFNNDLAIGQIQRLAGSRTMAIQQFQSIDNCFLTEKELIQVKNWVNMTTAENLVVTGVQPKDRFDSLWKFIPIPVLKATKIGNNNSINSTAMIGAGVKIGNNAQIAQGVSIGANVTIGNNVQIKKNVQIMDGAIIKDNVQINESSIIGKKTVVGVNAQIKKQVVIGDDVTIADNVQINDNVRIGNLVNIGTSSQIKQQAKIGDV